MAGPADRIIGLYQEHAAQWDASRGKSLGEKPWLDRFIAGLPLQGMILDLGCGAGEPIAAYFIACGFQVTGVDSSAPLVELCKARFPAQSWQVADMRYLALGSRFDGLIAWDSFFHLDHDSQRAMFPIFKNHAAPGAHLMFTSGTGHGEAIGTFADQPLYHASLDPAEYRRLLTENGFEVIRHVAEDPDCGGHTVWLCRYQG